MGAWGVQWALGVRCACGVGGSIGGAWGAFGGPRPATLSTCDFNDLNGAVYFDFMELVDC